MLGSYGASPEKSRLAINIGMLPGSSKKNLTKAKANNQGTQDRLANSISKRTKNRKLKSQVKAAAKGIPARPFIPKKSESFTSDIMIEIRKALAYCLNKAIKKGTKL
jgi:hypothetical protein